MGNNKYKTWIYGIGAAVVLGGLFAYPIMTDPNRPLVAEWKKAGLSCLNGHQNAAQHIHASLVINVNGDNELISGDIGVASGCMAELHVHGGQDNYLHIESVLPNKKFNLGQFFAVYRKPLERDGYTLEATVNGEIVVDPANLILADKQQIVFDYTSTSSVQAPE